MPLGIIFTNVLFNHKTSLIYKVEEKLILFSHFLIIYPIKFVFRIALFNKVIILLSTQVQALIKLIYCLIIDLVVLL